jgi:lipopolysaccharide export system protein LptC
MGRAVKALEQRADFRQSPPLTDESRPASRLGMDPYSRAVALLKRLLPVTGAALLLLVAAWPRLVPLLESVRLSASGIDPRAARELKMLNPRYAGIDRLNRPYVITAAVGRQLPNRSDLMSLKEPRAVMIVHGGASIVLTAATGIYQSQPRLLDLFDNVTLTHQNGTRFVTRRAHADLANSTAEGHAPIEGHGPSGDIWGQGFRVVDKGDTIIFTGQSRAILKGTAPIKPATPPGLPAEVRKTAALVEAAASAPEAPREAPAHPASRARAAPAAPHHPVARRHRTIRDAGKTPARIGPEAREARYHAD